MNLSHYNKFAVLAITCVAFQFLTVFLSGIKLYYFIPFLIVTFYQLSYIGCLWASLVCGVVIDCLSAHSFFGLNAFVYTLTTLLLYPQRSYFFADRLTTLPLMTYLFSTCATSLFIMCATIFEKRLTFSWSLVYNDLMLMPAADSLYALVIFVLPFQLFRQIQYKRKIALRRSR